MILPGIVGPEGRIDAPLGGDRMAADRMNFGNKRDVQTGRYCHSSPHAREAGSDNQDVMNFLKRSHAVTITLVFGMRQDVSVEGRGFGPCHESRSMITSIRQFFYS